MLIRLSFSWQHVVCSALFNWVHLNWGRNSMKSYNLLAKLYEQKKLSDQSLLLDSLWLLFAVVESVGVSSKSAVDPGRPGRAPRL